MCGITGQFTFALQPPETDTLIRQLCALQTRRGPDDQSIWTDHQHCAFGFRRLAILDLSPNGRQPMLTSDKRYALVMNGEVYNFKEIRRQLEQKGYRFRSSGDSEVVLNALAEWGKAALARFNGMFALAFYDLVEHRLLLARDHAGIKPLYYLVNQEGLVFGSQYDVLLAHPWGKSLTFNPQAASLYLRFGYIPAPYAIYQHTSMLEPGTWLEIDTSGKLQKGRYFEFPQFRQPELSGNEAYEAVEAAIQNAVRRQMVSDVPLGSFLSGGIDSSLITAIAQSFSTQPIKSVTIGVEDSAMDESAAASLYASKIGVQHHLEIASLNHVESLVQDSVSACSEPFGDYSIIPTLLAAQAASRHVKVMLSGDGGDELFYGYTARMSTAIRYARLFSKPFILRKLRWFLLRRPGEWNTRYFRTAGEWYQSRHERNFQGLLENIFPEIAGFPSDYLQYKFDGYDEDQTAQWVRWNEFTGHLQNGLLKVDRGSMFHSLEVRVPLLDREVIDTALRVDWRSCLDLAAGTGKLPLRQILQKKVQHQTSGKRGFTVPMAAWLKGPLKQMFSDLVLGREELLGLPMNHAAIKNIWREQQDGSVNREWGLWILLSAALWQSKHQNQ